MTAAVMSGLGIQLAGAVTGPLLAHELGSHGRGLVAQLQTPFLLLVGVASSGLSAAVARHENDREGGRVVGTAGLLALGLSAVIMAALAVTYPLFLHRSASSFTVLIIAYVAAVPASLFSAVAAGLLVGRGTGRLWNVLRLLPFGVNLVGLLLWALIAHLTVRSAALIQVLALFLGALACLPLVRRLGSLTPQRQLLAPLTASVLSTGLLGLGQTAFASIDSVYLAARAKPSVVGNYVVAYAFAGLLDVVASGIAFAAFRDFKHRRPSMLGAHAERLTFALSITGGMALALLAPWVVPLAFGNSFHFAVHLVWLLLPGRVCADVYTSASTRLVAEGRNSAVRRLGIASVILTLVAAISGWWLDGASGVALAMTVAQAVRLGISLMLRTRNANEAANE